MREGGIVNTAYLDSKGVPTIGIGCTGPDIVLGMTRTDAQCIAVFRGRYGMAALGAARAIGAVVWASIDPVRQAALIDIAYQDGVNGLAGFHLMIAAVLADDWQEASAQCLASHNLTESPDRCRANAEMLLTGLMPTRVNGAPFSPNSEGFTV
jgi:GH24 family phage-related lysozyme (muramidase)